MNERLANFCEIPFSRLYIGLNSERMYQVYYSIEIIESYVVIENSKIRIGLCVINSTKSAFILGVAR